jgi:hypothetical protein
VALHAEADPSGRPGDWLNPTSVDHPTLSEPGVCGLPEKDFVFDVYDVDSRSLDDVTGAELYLERARSDGGSDVLKDHGSKDACDAPDLAR